MLQKKGCRCFTMVCLPVITTMTCPIGIVTIVMWHLQKNCLFLLCMLLGLYVMVLDTSFHDHQFNVQKDIFYKLREQLYHGTVRGDNFEKITCSMLKVTSLYPIKDTYL